MARLLILEFEDNEDVDKYLTDDRWDVYGATIHGVYAVPTKFCECRGSASKRMAFTRTPKFGWWIHADCKKPTRAWAKCLLPETACNVENLLPDGWCIPELGSPESHSDAPDESTLPDLPTDHAGP